LKSVTLKRVSICPCGYRAVNDGCDVGKPYLIDESTIQGGFFWQCGGCRLRQADIRVVEVEQADGTTGLLPYDLFVEAQ
jgi:hypothetical protein